MTILSVAEKTYNLFWNDMGWPGGLMIIGIALAVTGIAILSNYRNLCAHEDMLYSNRTQKSIPDNEIHEILKINKIDDEYIYGKNDLFSVIIMLKELLTKSDFNDFFNEFNYEMKILESKILTLSKETLLMKLGFPNNFEDIKEI